MRIIDEFPIWGDPLPEAVQKMNMMNVFLLWATILLDAVSLCIVFFIIKFISMSTVWALILLVAIKIAVLIAAMIPAKKKAKTT